MSARVDLSVCFTVWGTLESRTVGNFAPAPAFASNPSLARLDGDNFSCFRNAIPVYRNARLTPGSTVFDCSRALMRAEISFRYWVDNLSDVGAWATKRHDFFLEEIVMCQRCC